MSKSRRRPIASQYQVFLTNRVKASTLGKIAEEFGVSTQTLATACAGITLNHATAEFLESKIDSLPK